MSVYFQWQFIQRLRNYAYEISTMFYSDVRVPDQVYVTQVAYIWFNMNVISLLQNMLLCSRWLFWRVITSVSRTLFHTDAFINCVLTCLFFVEEWCIVVISNSKNEPFLHRAKERCIAYTVTKIPHYRRYCFDVSPRLHFLFRFL